MEAAYKYRFYPTKEQARNLAQTFGSCRYVYNWGLRIRSDAYHTAGKTLRYGDTSSMLTALKRTEDHAWLNDVSSVPVQQALRHLDEAYTRFFRGHARFPSFKRKHDRQSAEYTTSGYRLRDSGTPGQPLVYLAKQSEPLSIRWSRPLPSAPKTITVSRDAAGRYFVSFRVVIDPAERSFGTPHERTNRAVGVDRGLIDVIVTSDGERSGNPRHLGRDLARLARAQRRLARKEKGSRNREKARRKVARIHARIADRRQDFTHKLTTDLVRRYDVICVESLRVKNLMRNRSLARSIGDAGWGEILRQLRYKAEWYGRTLVELDTFYPSSKRCSACGHIAGKMPLSVREWVCEECGVEHDRDVNAAVNLLAAGQAVIASGLGVRPRSASAEKAV